MSSYPAKVSREALIEQAWHLIEEDGVDTLSLGKLAAAMGIKAASLYHHFPSKASLLQAVNTRTVTELVAAMQRASEPTSDAPPARMRRMAQAYRAYALAHPAIFSFAFSNSPQEIQPDAALAEQLVLPLQAVMAQISGEERSLAALRGALAIVHGFAILELGGQFRRGGNLDEAFQQVIDVYLAGWIIENR